MSTHFLTYIQKSMKEFGDCPALTNYKGNSYSYSDVAQEIARYHVLFEAIGIKKGDHVAICARNSAEWGIAFLAITSYQSVVVSLLNDFTPDSIQSLVAHSESVLFFTEKEKWDALNHESIPLVNTVISLTDNSLLYSRDGKATDFFPKWGRAFDEKYPDGFSVNEVNYPVDNLEELALINYTSGTTSFSIRRAHN